MTEAITLWTRSAAETQSLAATISRLVGPGTVIALTGELGTGKTVFVRGFCDAIGVPDSAGVASPSYALMHLYDGGDLPVAHLDLFRLDHVDDLESFGFRDVFDGHHVVLIEWPERVAEALAAAHLRVVLADKGGDARLVTVQAEEESLAQALRSALDAPRPTA